MSTHRCPVRGHDHDLDHVSDHRQAGTGETAELVECPTGRYRWFLVGDREPNAFNRQTRPRYGWPSSR